MWYYALGESEHGPISDDEMQALIANGTVGPTTQVWKEGMAEWGPASGVPGLISAGAPRTAAATPVAPAPDASAFDASNPYSQSADVGTTADFGSSPGLPYDTFTKVVLIIDTVLCGLQILVQGASILGLLLMRNAPQVEVGPLMIVSIVVVFLVIGFALTADIMLLRRNRSGCDSRLDRCGVGSDQYGSGYRHSGNANERSAVCCPDAASPGPARRRRRREGHCHRLDGLRKLGTTWHFDLLRNGSEPSIQDTWAACLTFKEISRNVVLHSWG